VDGLSIAASLAEISTNIVGSTIRTIYHPAHAQFVLRVFSGEDVRLAIDLREASIRITSQVIENPASPSAFAMFLRKHLRGGRVAELIQCEWDRVVSLDITRMDGVERHSYQLIAELVGTRGNLLLFQDGALLQSLRSDDRNHVGRPYVGLPRQDKLDPSDILPSHIERWLNDSDANDVLSKHVEGIGRQTAADVVNQAQGEDLPMALTFGLRDLLTHVQDPRPHVSGDGTRATFYPLPAPAIGVDSYQTALDRVRSEPRQESLPPQDTLLAELTRAVRAKTRTIEKLHDWLDTSSQADTWQSQADLLMIYQSGLARGLPEAVLTRLEDGEEVTIALDPSLSALENAQALYARAKRIRRGHPHVHARLEKCAKELDKLQRALERRARGDAVDAETLKLLPGRRKQKPVAKKAVPFRQFEVLGHHIWVGKSARQNDALLRAAAPNDLWMHAKDYAGSHVVIRVRGQDPIPDEVMQAAGRLAAQYSKAGSERRVEVTMTRVKNVRKPKGAPAGLVNVRDTDTLTVELAEGEA
jgi:predicted ribosome quality control (RQC) complex YloA/Tae2 family protein